MFCKIFPAQGHLKYERILTVFCRTVYIRYIVFRTVPLVEYCNNGSTVCLMFVSSVSVCVFHEHNPGGGRFTHSLNFLKIHFNK